GGGPPSLGRPAPPPPPVFALLGVAAAALGSGADVVALMRPLLKPRDAQNTLAIVSVARSVAPILLLLAGLALVGAFLMVRARRTKDWRRLAYVIAAVTIAWTAAIGIWLRPPIGRAASLQPFMARVDGLVPPDATLYGVFPPEGRVRF